MSMQFNVLFPISMKDLLIMEILDNLCLSNYKLFIFGAKDFWLIASMKLYERNLIINRLPLLFLKMFSE